MGLGSMAFKLGAELDEQRGRSRAALAREIDDYAFQGSRELLKGADGKVIQAVSAMGSGSEPVDEMPSLKPFSDLPEKGGIRPPIKERLNRRMDEMFDMQNIPHYASDGVVVDMAEVQGNPVAAVATAMNVTHLGRRTFLIGEFTCQTLLTLDPTYSEFVIPEQTIDVPPGDGGCYIGLLCRGSMQLMSGSYHFIVTSVEVAARSSLASDNSRSPTFYDFTGVEVFQPCAYVIPPQNDYPYPIVFHDRTGESLASELSAWPNYTGFDG